MPLRSRNTSRRAITAPATVTANWRLAPGMSFSLSVLARAVDNLQTWQDRARERAALRRLDDRLLHDIGVSRADADAEFRKPFWRP